jgi:sugar phosphate isomerase/epimerase
MPVADLIAACWTAAGACDARPDTLDDRSPLPIRRRVEAVAAAGFTGFGIRHGDLLRVEADPGFPAFRRMLDDHGLRILELEFLEGWFLPASDPRRAASDAARADFLRAAEALGARHIKIGADFDGGPFEPERMAPHLAELARQAADAGTRVALEPMPFTNVRTPFQGLELVDLVDHRAAGLCIDIWHVERVGVPVAEVARIPGHRIVAVEPDDAPREPEQDLLPDTFAGRRFPGEGDFDVAGFVAAIRATGFDGAFGVEMLSTAFRALSVEEATRRAYQSAARFVTAG